MTMQLDHLIVPARDRQAAAERLAPLLRVSWAAIGLGPLSPFSLVYVNSTPHGPVDSSVNTARGGRIVYWSVPDGHVWEALTLSHARQSPAP